MKVIKKKLSELRRPKKNVRNHSIKQIEEFKRSVQMFGQIRPIVIDEDNVILAGNGLFMALEALGRTEADCYVAAGLTEAGVEFRWYCLPLKQVSAFHQLQNDESWITWELGKEEQWVRKPPPFAILRSPYVKYPGQMNFQSFC